VVVIVDFRVRSMILTTVAVIDFAVFVADFEAKRQLT
jgi:hypothetical protein